MSKEQIVYIVDDDEGARDSLAALLEASGMKTQPFSSGDAFLEAIEPNWQGCIILDVRMPGLTGPEVQEKLGEAKNKLPIIIVSGHGDLPMAVKAIQAGAHNFIEKPYDEATILRSIEKALLINEDIVLEDMALSEINARYEKLTEREREVLVQVAIGSPNKVIAYDLGISPRTVEIHRARVIEKMNVKTLPDLVRITIRAGILPDNKAVTT